MKMEQIIVFMRNREINLQVELQTIGIDIIIIGIIQIFEQLQVF